MALQTTTNWLPESKEDKDRVYGQLQKIFASPAFKSSRRCPAFLQYIVDHRLRGDTQQLKERTIGVEVFGRDADYDTNAEPIVRTTASEVRRRIAQYYHGPGHENDIRIELPLGSYNPEFHLPPEPVSPGAATPAGLQPGPVPERNLTDRSTNYRRLRLVIIAVGLAVVIAAPFVWRIIRKPIPAISQFWNPVLKSSGPILVCLNTWDISSLLNNSASPLAKGAAQAGIDFHEWLPLSDAATFSQLTGFLGVERANYRMQGARSTTISDLMQGPVVLVGVFGNPWTQRVTDPLRFHFMPSDGRSGVYIADRKDPSRRYSVEGDPTSGSERDYAIVGRVSNAATGQVSIVVAGLNAAGTIAASDLVTSPRYMDYLQKELPSSSSLRNIEALISVQVVGGRPGAPHIEATDVW
jgi:hypothetical protein